MGTEPGSYWFFDAEKIKKYFSGLNQNGMLTVLNI
jgi:hypothetical protein